MQRRISFWVAVVLCGASSVARAEQFTLVDVSYTHSADTTNDSHYYVMLPADTPKDWTKPVDWSNGSVHMIVEVKTKPAGGAKTKMQACFEGTPSYQCTDQSPTYTTTGKVEWDSQFKNFWKGGELDWSKGIKKLPLILKDDQNNKPAGDPKYMPTDLHVQMFLVSPGAKFVPPAAGSGGTGGAAAGTGAGGTGGAAGAAAGSGATGAAAGTGAAGMAGAAGKAGAGAGGSSGGSGAAVGGAGAGTGAAASGAAGRAAGGSSGAATAGAAAALAGAASPAAGAGATAGAGTMTNAQTAERAAESDGGCRSAGKGLGGVWLFAGLLAWSALRRRRR